MRNKLKILTIVLLFSVLQIGLQAQEKLAQTGFQFLSVVPDARAAALADAMTTVENSSAALWANPAMLAESKNMLDIALNMNNWIADITHNAFSASFRPAEGQYGVFGISIKYVDYGDVERTIVANNEQGYMDMGLIQPNAYSIGFGYARRLTNKFSVGAQLKRAGQYLGPVISDLDAETDLLKQKQMRASVWAFDFGTYYKTGWKSLSFGMSVRNFSQEIKYSDENFQLPLTFSVGISANIMDYLPGKYFSDYLQFSLDAVHPRSHPEYLKTGLELRLMDLFDLRLGYMSNTDEANVTFGFGLHKFGFDIDYAYIPYGAFDNVQRFGLRFSL